MKPLRILIVESSSTTRQTLRRLLGCDLDFEIVGDVATGRVAVARLSEFRPDVVLLDIAPPDKEGLKTLAALREAQPVLPVIVFSRLTERGSQTTVDALLLGANDYVTKPASDADLAECVRGEVTRKLKAFRPSAVSIAATRTSDIPAPTQTITKEMAVATRKSAVTPESVEKSVEIISIAASTGGPDALASLLSSLPASFTTPIVIVQHMAAGFTAGLAESLRRQTGRNVREALTVQPLHAAAVWIAPGGRHLKVAQQGSTLQVVPNGTIPENECCPSADVLFRSVAEVFGSSSMAVVLTGMGCDGLAGCRAIRQAGGMIVVQDEASSVCWGMPGQVASAGLADRILPLDDLPREISRYEARSRYSKK